MNIDLSGSKVSELTPSRVDTPNGSISVSWSSNSDGGERDRQAEEAARIVAAAPDLFNTLICARRWIETATNGMGLHGKETLSLIDYVIAKASGESA